MRASTHFEPLRASVRAGVTSHLCAMKQHNVAVLASRLFTYFRFFWRKCLVFLIAIRFY